MSFALQQKRRYTIEDINNLPDGERAELIDGEIYNMATPSRIHQEILSMLFNKIYNYIDSTDGPCKVYPAPFAVFLDKSDFTMLNPI